jgi:prepilin-type N-terminal cleavage/methylation domain-containing protein
MKGFSFLELSIVMTIISLLMAAATSGQHILKKAQLHSRIKQLKGTESSVILFKEQYRAYPGDFSKAYRYFSYNKVDICGKKPSCNGDGDRKIEIGTKKDSSEVYRAVQHLQLAELIKGDYSGEWGEDNYVIETTPEGNITPIYQANIGNILKYGSFLSIKGQTSDNGLLTTKEAQMIDEKIDDGSAIKGDIRAIQAIDYNKEKCINSNMYNLSTTKNPVCVLGLKI